MNHKEAILDAFRKNNGVLTLGYALQFYWGYKLTSRISELKKEGHPILFMRGKTPSENAWRLIEVEKSGQLIAI